MQTPADPEPYLRAALFQGYLDGLPHRVARASHLGPRYRAVIYLIAYHIIYDSKLSFLDIFKKYPYTMEECFFLFQHVRHLIRKDLHALKKGRYSYFFLRGGWEKLFSFHSRFKEMQEAARRAKGIDGRRRGRPRTRKVVEDEEDVRETQG